MSIKKLTPGQLREFRSKVARLKRKGLVSSRVDARKVKPTYYMRKQVERFAPVLEGKASVVKVPKKERGAFDFFQQKLGRVVVPKQPTAVKEHARYNKKTKQIEGSTSEIYGNKVRRLFVTKQLNTVSDLPTQSPSGNPVIYAVPFRNVHTGEIDYIYKTDLQELVAFMTEYTKYHHPEKYIEVWEIIKPSPEMANGGEIE